MIKLFKYQYAALICFTFIVLSNNAIAATEGVIDRKISTLSKEDVDIINNLELLEMMELLEDYDLIEGYNGEDEEEEDDV